MNPLDNPLVPSSNIPGFKNIPNAGFFPQKSANPNPIRRGTLPPIPRYTGNNPAIRAQINGYGVTNNAGVVNKSGLTPSQMSAPTSLSGIQGFKNGGTIPKTGIYKLHEGEKVIPKYQVNNMKVGQPTSGQPVSMNKQDGNPSSPVHIDRMEGSIPGKNKSGVFAHGKHQSVVKNVGKDIAEL